MCKCFDNELTDRKLPQTIETNETDPTWFLIGSKGYLVLVLVRSINDFMTFRNYKEIEWGFFSLIDM